MRFQSSAAFVDSETAKRKIDLLSRQQLAEFFLLSWHPIVELEQLTRATLNEAITYWEQLLPFFERRKRLELGPLAYPGGTNLGELTSSGLLDDKAFTRRLHEFWEEMKEKNGSGPGLEYWGFVRADSFHETVKRAQFVSFLLTYGFAALEKKGERIMLIPRETPKSTAPTSPMSLPIAIKKDA